MKGFASADRCERRSPGSGVHATGVLELVHSLGPLDEDAVLADDEREQFPREATTLLERGVLEYMVPRSCGGRMESLEQTLLLGRLISRRDLTAGVALGQALLGALPVWIAGSTDQKRELSAILMAGELSCLALTEQEHGSDLLANAMTLRIDNGRAFLNGSKWCVNNATRGRAMCLLVKTIEHGGDVGHSMIMLDKRAGLRGDTYLPKLRTHGVRGADISGVSFDNSELSPDRILKRAGTGLEIALKTLQVSRTLCAAFSLGALDGCVRDALTFAKQRILYGRPVFEIDTVQHRLARQYCVLLVCESLAAVVSRIATLMPAQLPLYSAIVKFLVPNATERGISELADILGARNYLREGDYALFQKRKRDHNVVGLFDGSSDVNLYVICGMLPGVLGKSLKEAGLSSAEIFDTSRAAPPFDGQGLKTLSWGSDVIVQQFLSPGFRAALTRCDARTGSGLEAMHSVLERHWQEVRDEHARLASLPGGWRSMSYEAHQCAQRYARVLAGLCCFQYCLENSELAGLASPGVLKTILGHWFGHAAWIDNEPILRLGQSQVELRQLFSFQPVALELRNGLDDTKGA